MPLTPDFIDQLTALVGPRYVISDPTGLAPFLHEERGLYHGTAEVVVKPATTEQVAEVVILAAAHGVAIVPQGGNTGLCGGAVAERGQLILSLARLNKVRAFDPTNFTLTVEAGCVLSDLHTVAADAGCLFPLSLGAQWSCQIGGNLATNAGGINVLRYGNARDLCLGLEVVLPDGQIWHGLRALGKDNTGYALKHLFIGGEGTIGIITAAVLKLFPAVAEKRTAFLALDDIANVTKLLAVARQWSGDAVTGFELISRFGLEIATQHLQAVHDPFTTAYPWYVLVEVSTSRPDADLKGLFDGFLEAAFEAGIVVDGVVAESLEQAHMLWRMREQLPEAQKHEGGSIKHDVSVPVASVPAFLTEALSAVQAAMPGLRPCPFGHVGDGNIHFNLTQPVGMERAAFLAEWETMNRIVHDIVIRLGGSVSAEHGVGLLKVDEIVHYKSPLEISLMQAVKRAFDPSNRFNPGKVVRI